MKYVKTDKWIRLRGQMGPNNEICKIDTPVSDKERVFFVPNTEEEKSFFYVDTVLNYTGIPYGPTSHDPEEWGWRFYADKTEADMEKFAASISESMKNVYEQGINVLDKTGKKPIMN